MKNFRSIIASVVLLFILCPMGTKGLPSDYYNGNEWMQACMQGYTFARTSRTL